VDDTGAHTVLILGGRSEIGTELAVRLAPDASVVLAARNADRLGEQTAAILAAGAVAVSTREFDADDVETHGPLVASIIAEHGPIHTAVLAFGILGDQGRAEIDAFVAAYGATGDKVDVVVFAAPQLSLVEMAAVADALSGREVHSDTTLLVTTSPEIKHAADRMGLTRRIEEAGGIVAAGICFYQSYAGELAEANGWKRLLTNSAKLVNIIGGYGYRPTLMSLERCIDSAIAGRVV